MPVRCGLLFVFIYFYTSFFFSALCVRAATVRVSCISVIVFVYTAGYVWVGQWNSPRFSSSQVEPLR